MKIGIYCRVSLDETDETKKQFQSTDNQLQPLLDYAKAMGYEVNPDNVYMDKMKGANPNRPNFRKMLADAMMRRFSGILIWKLDRFSREGILPTLSYINQLKSRGIWLKSLTESWLDTTPENSGITEIVLSIMAWCASEEKLKISQRTKAGIKRLRDQGKWRGGRPKKGGVISANDSTLKTENKISPK